MTDVSPHSTAHVDPDSTAPAGVSLIAGHPVVGEGAVFHGADPRGTATGLPGYAEVTIAQLDLAVMAAARARRAPIDRSALAIALDHAAAGFEQAADRVVATADAETALGEVRLRGELARTVGQLRMMATEARTGTRRDIVVDPAGEGPAAPALHRTTLPIGVIAVFAASNFPLAFGVAGTDTAAALGAGCPVVAKAHPAQPATAELCGQIIAAGIAAAALDPGFFSVLHESGYHVGQALVQHPQVDAVAFTGSHAGGRALLDAASARPRPIPVYAEMGSLNPLFVSPLAAAVQPQDLADGIVGSYLLGEGQFCTKPGLVVLPDGPDGDALLAAMVDRLRGHATAHPLLHDGIVGAFAAGLDEVTGLAGVTVAHGPDAEHGCQAVLLLAELDALTTHPILRQELFGPATVVVRATEEQARTVVDLLEPALTATVHFTAEEQDWAREMADLLARKVGRVVANGYPTGVRVSPGQHHGGPYPATTSPLHTSVGLAAIDRFQRPVTFQSFDGGTLPSWADA